ncbi:MAG: bestrophin family ion channel, partial [Planctomycetota bacterium]|nr:bestrophin family ion channel [Planctomycetota bacterium]
MRSILPNNQDCTGKSCTYGIDRRIQTELFRHQAWSPALMAILALGMFGMEETSVEIEDPFGTQPKCLKLEVLTITIPRDSGQLAAHDEIMDIAGEESSNTEE